ncbi:SIR2 family protein [Elizabethkingia meningoseptica]|uniref:SIR2 family protein n=1 Tax=Elizabethkingia meningoseptica TaxID=238 RepID=UPI0023B1EC9F|nr:SIR2 family protein [Elizabethkingia meningoseptica]MDE5432703.1 SIR2 family protein [Elizabethkingia meningoseptica]
MKYLYINGQNSVAITNNAQEVVEQVYINGEIQDFDDPSSIDKETYAEQTKRKLYSKFLNNHFENLLVLTGAGSSVGIGVGDHKGKVLTQLWDSSVKELGEQDFEILRKLVNYNDRDDKGDIIKNLEKLLSFANTAIDYVQSEEINILDCVNRIKKLIKKECSLTLPEDNPHGILLNKITKRKVTSPRFKLFTLNYDTLFEQAGKRSNFTIIDGFSFSLPRVFSGRNFDLDIVSRSLSRVKEEDNFVPKVFHLYKMHGSVDWYKEGFNICQKDNVENPLMIYPNQSKYESSYEQPYFEMMSRFQQSLRNENVTLICIGFSFGDKHVVTAIKEALEQNSSFQLMVVNKSIDEANENIKPIIEAAKKHNNIVFVAETFDDFVTNYPDLKSYNQDEQYKVFINLNNNINE